MIFSPASSIDTRNKIVARFSNTEVKRYRIFGFDLDRRALTLQVQEQGHWSSEVKEQLRHNQEKISQELVAEFGEENAAEKRKEFVALGPKPLSIFAFHNRFLAQIRKSFVMGGYYPALTGACALGERILNHLILLLRDDFKATSYYKRIYRKQSFDNWDLAIEALEIWEVLLPAVAMEFRKLRNTRNDAIHFRPEVDNNDRELALDAVKTLEVILSQQFSAFGSQPWFITNIPGEIYIKRDWETKPFIRRVYLPNGALVGPAHKVLSVRPWIIDDRHPYENTEASDEEFGKRRLQMRHESKTLNNA